MTPETVAILRQAIGFIQDEHDTIVDSYTVRASGHPNRGQVIDRAAQHEVEIRATWLEKARKLIG